MPSLPEDASRRLTYCGNVHPARNLADWQETVERFAVPVARRFGGAEPFGLGVWWPADVVRELAHDQRAQASVRDLLARHGLRILTVNAFPFGDFHAGRVKQAVYRPDWADDARLEFTLDVARAVCALEQPECEVPISTLPLGYGGGDVPRMQDNLIRAAREFAALEQRAGVVCVLALEPEPCCLVETVAEAIACVEAVRERAGGDERVRRHLGVCVDLCHLAVMGEEPVAAWRALEVAGISAPKVQVSACLEVRAPEALDRLLAYDEPRYLHQTVAETRAGRVRALDLGEVVGRRAEFAAARRIRTHFHVPIFWDEPGSFGSTQREVVEFLHRLRPPLPVLEVETYTWSVLPGRTGGDAELVSGLVRELGFVREHLTPSARTLRHPPA